MNFTMKSLGGVVSTPITLTGWALLNVEGLMLAMPQKDIVMIEISAALQPALENIPGRGSAIAWVKQDAQLCPVFCLDWNLRALSVLPETARVFAMFRAEESIFGLACSQVSLLAEDADITVLSLPACLKRLDSPLTGLALHNNMIVTVLNARTLHRYLSTLELLQDD